MIWIPISKYHIQYIADLNENRFTFSYALNNVFMVDIMAKLAIRMHIEVVTKQQYIPA